MAKPRLTDSLTAEQLKSLLDYSPESGAFTWRPRSEDAFPAPRYCKSWNTRYAGQLAGSPTIPTGYIQVLVAGKLYLAHRLAWLWTEGEWPETEIDHIDGNRTNNKISNLRPASSSQNRMNSRLRSDNSSGFKGVSWSEDRNKWVAEINANGRKRFLGYFDTRELAHAAYCEAATRLHGEYARFS